MTEEDEVIKQWLAENPYDPNDPSNLPAGWEIRFNKRGRFYPYKDVEEAERRNMCYHRELQRDIPFGYINDEWEAMKSLMQEGDEIWLWGHDGVTVLLVRDGQIIKEMLYMMLC